MDPILEEMRRVKSLSEVRESRYRDWVDYLAGRLARLDELEQAVASAKKAKVSA